ncbi:hypothetical protein E0198_002271 [Clavispora lusitaniae]|nr:hypothetical protein E0198_002271 [Clavispora lusitaniae]
MRATTLDPQASRVLAHLQELVADGAAPDPSLVDDYAAHVSAHPDAVVSGRVLDSPVLIALAPLLARVLHAPPDACYARLLSALLAPLPFADTLKFFSRDHVEAAAQSPSHPVMALAVHVVRAALERHDTDAEEFVRTSDFLPIVVRRVLAEPLLPVAVVADVEAAVRVHAASQHFTWEPWQFLLERPSAVNTDAAVAARYVGIIEPLAARSDMVPLAAVEKLCAFDVEKFFEDEMETEAANKTDLNAEVVELVKSCEEILPHEDETDAVDDKIDNPSKPTVQDSEDDASHLVDPLLAPIVIDFYARLVRRIPLYGIRHPVARCMVHLAHRRQVRCYNAALDPPLSALFSSLSACGSTVPVSRAFLIRLPALADFDFSAHHDVLAFCLLDLAVIPDKDTYFSDHFSAWHLARVPYPRFHCLLHLIDNVDFFALFAKAWLSDAIVAALAPPRVYELVARLALYDHSASVMLEKLPLAVDTYLAQPDRSLVNPDLWSLKRDALHHLLFNRSLDLGAWRQPLTASYSEMVNGRKVRAIDPQVAVESRFA